MELCQLQVDTLHFHPATSLVPKMNEEEWKEFLEDVRERGIVTPIEVLSDGSVVDGVHRVRAAKEVGISHVPARIINPKEDIEEYILKAAILRRHLNDDQRATLASLWKEKQKKKQKSSYGIAKKAKDVFNVTRKKLEQATTVVRRSPELAQRILNGEIGLSQAYRKVAEPSHTMDDNPDTQIELFEEREPLEEEKTTMEDIVKNMEDSLSELSRLVERHPSLREFLSKKLEERLSKIVEILNTIPASKKLSVADTLLKEVYSHTKNGIDDAELVHVVEHARRLKNLCKRIESQGRTGEPTVKEFLGWYIQFWNGMPPERFNNGGYGRVGKELKELMEVLMERGDENPLEYIKSLYSFYVETEPSKENQWIFGDRTKSFIRFRRKFAEIEAYYRNKLSTSGGSSSWTHEGPSRSKDDSISGCTSYPTSKSPTSGGPAGTRYSMDNGLEGRYFHGIWLSYKDYPRFPYKIPAGFLPKPELFGGVYPKEFWTAIIKELSETEPEKILHRGLEFKYVNEKTKAHMKDWIEGFVTKLVGKENRDLRALSR